MKSVKLLQSAPIAQLSKATPRGYVHWVERIHETSAELTMVLVVVHVAAIIVMGRITNIPLIRTMITGKRNV